MSNLLYSRLISIGDKGEAIFTDLDISILLWISALLGCWVQTWLDNGHESDERLLIGVFFPEMYGIMY